MPWCEDCSRWWSPAKVAGTGACPTCLRVIAEVAEPRAPWHFKVLVGAAALYLGFRAWEGVAWLVGRL